MSADFDEGSNPGKLKFGLNDGNSVYLMVLMGGEVHEERGYVPMPGITDSRCNNIIIMVALS